MSAVQNETLSVVVERDFPHPPDKLWRALTQPHLIEEWLMTCGDFQPVVDHRFGFQAEWGAVDCVVTAVEPGKVLAYTWTGLGIDSVVTWTLTPTDAGTLLRMEQTGFQPGQRQAYHGARHGWPRFLAQLEQVLARAE
ncbi:MAG: SRPBCC domain-containing protein [Tardiphaga sp.]